MDKRERNRIKRARLKKGRRRPGAGRRDEIVWAPSSEDLVRASDDPAMLEAFATDLMDQGRLIDACEVLRLATGIRPRSKTIAGRYLKAAELAGDLSHEIDALEHMLVLLPGSPAAIAHLAGLHRRAGDERRAAEIEGYLLMELRGDAGPPGGRADRAAFAEPDVPFGRGVISGRGARRPRVVQHALPFAVPETRANRSPAPEIDRRPRPEPGRRVRRDPVATVPPPARRGRPRPAPSTVGKRAAPKTQAPADASPPSPLRREPMPPAAGATVPVAAPEPPRELEIPIVVAGEIAGLDALSRDPRDGLEDLELALLAAQLRDAESFDRLLALDRATGLIRLSHQEETARKVMSTMLGRALLADEVGLGKTIEAGLVLAEYLARGRVKRALVLAPASLVGQWREELSSKFGIESRSSEDDALRRDPEPFWGDDGVVLASLATARGERHRERVAGRPWDIVIVDEAHSLKNHRTESYALVERLKSRFLLLLTATPVESRVDELFNLVSLIRPGHLGGRTEFVRRFSGTGGKPSESAGAELRRLLAELMVRNTRALSGVDLPPRFARTELVVPGADEERLYADLSAALRALESAGRARQILSLLLQEAGSSPHAVRDTLVKVREDETLPPRVRAELTACAESALRVSGSEKARALLVALASNGGPAIVFTRFRGTLSFLARVLDDSGIAYHRLDGDTPVRQRMDAIEGCRATGGVLLSTDVGSEGLNLQFCRRIVNFDLPWNPMRLEQRIGRLHRIGQEHPVEVLNLCLAGSIEERILEILDRRINLFELVIGEIETILGYLDGDFSDLVLAAHSRADESERTRAFASLGDALAAARQRYRGVKSFDEGLFRSELGV